MKIVKHKINVPIEKMQKAIKEQKREYSIKEYMSCYDLEKTFGYDTLNRQTLYNWCKKGLIKYNRKANSRTMYINVQSLFEYIERRALNGYSTIYV